MAKNDGLAHHSDVEFLRVVCSHMLDNSDPFAPGAQVTGLAQADLERLTGLSRPSVANLIRRFKNILESTAQNGVGTSRLALNPAVGLAVGVDFGHGHASVAVSDLSGGVLASSETYVGSDPFGGPVGTPETPPARGPQQVDWAATQVSRLLEQVGRGPDHVAGVGISLPGPVNRNDEYAVIRAEATIGTGGQTPFQSLRPAVHLKEALAKPAPQWRKVPFVVDNDVNLQALAERTWGLAREVSDLIYVDWSRGIGAGLILGGRVFRGGGAAGELGHVIVADAEERRSLEPCQRCGNVGCLESVASLERITAQLGAQLASVPGPDLVNAVIGMLQGGPGREVLRQAADYMTRALGSLITALNPQLVVIGGGFGTQAYDLIKNDLLEGIGRRTMPPAKNDVTILGAMPRRLGELPEELRPAARRTGLLGALASIVNPNGTEFEPVISYLKNRV